MLNNALNDVLLATGPAPQAAPELALFGQFEGVWDLDVRWFSDGELTRRENGEWYFGWILGGRAIQDVWIVPTLAEQAVGAGIYEYGTSLRFYDGTIGSWRSTWIGPVQHAVRTFIANGRGDEIVLHGEQIDGRDIEWVFSDILPDSFRWRFRKRIGAGEEWETVQAFECRRRK